MEHELAIEPLTVQWHTAQYIPESYKIIFDHCLNLEKSGSIHIDGDIMSTQGRSYCMTHGGETSNLQAVNTVQHRSCSGATWGVLWSARGNTNQSSCWRASGVSELCSGCVKGDKQESTRSISTSPALLSVFFPKQSPPATPLSNQWEGGGIWLKVNNS